MPRPYSNRRRRRPGRRPPDRRSRWVKAPSRPRGYTGPGWGAYYRWLLPGLRGGEKREFFNGITLWIIAIGGYGGGLVGYEHLGVAGALAGVACGLVATLWFCVRQGLFRP